VTVFQQDDIRKTKLISPKSYLSLISKIEYNQSITIILKGLCAFSPAAIITDDVIVNCH